MKLYRDFGKRGLDFLLSSVLILLFWPLGLLIALWIRLDSKGPVVFCQERLTKGGKVFKMYKFRTMIVNAEQTGTGVYSFQGDNRVTKAGKILRKLSLDELLQIVNIWKGEMSFIGPRPILTYHPCKFNQYTEKEKTVFEVRPGITGWAQVNGRNSVNWDRRFELNEWYVEHVSFLLDVKILFLTVKQIFVKGEVESTAGTADSFANRK